MLPNIIHILNVEEWITAISGYIPEPILSILPIIAVVASLVIAAVGVILGIVAALIGAGVGLLLGIVIAGIGLLIGAVVAGISFLISAVIAVVGFLIGLVLSFIGVIIGAGGVLLVYFIVRAVRRKKAKKATEAALLEDDLGVAFEPVINKETHLSDGALETVFETAVLEE